MFGKKYTLFKMFGFQVHIDLSWLVIVALVVWSLAGGLFPMQYPGLAWWAYLLMGLAGALGLFASIVLHELSHSLVARRFGLPIKGITLFIFGGVAEMSEEPPSAKAEFVMAIAGPLASLALALLFYLGFLASEVAGATVLAAVLGWLAVINLILAVFNMLPGFPLDGGRVLRSILWQAKKDLRKATYIASRVGAIFGLLLIGLGFVNLLMLNPIGGLWWILIGWFLRMAAKQGYRQILIRQALQGEPIRRFMNTRPITVSPSLTVQELVDDYIYKYHYKMLPVVDQGRLAGCVTTRSIKDLPRSEWRRRTVGDIISPCDGENTVSSDEDAIRTLAIMNRNQLSRLMVVEGDELVGIIALKDLLNFLARKLELEADDVTIADLSE